MKLTILLLTVGFMNVFARGHSQSVTFSGTDVSLKSALIAIEEQTGYHWFVNEELLTNSRPVSIKAVAVPLIEFLDEILKGQFTFNIRNKNIVLKPVSFIPKPVLETSPPFTGFVRDSEGRAISGVTITLIGAKRGTTTDATGRFTISANIGDVLVVSSIGYVTKEIKLTTRGNYLMIVLVKALNKLDEVQIIAYGEKTRRFQTGNVGSVKSEDIERQPVNNPMLALQGRVPGLFITQSSGLPGTTVSVQIQGKNSMAQGTDPFYVVDGVPFNARMLQGISTTVSTTSPFTYLNPSDIESIEVLKDADATSIYGSRAANGAILITTKKGKAGKTQVAFNIQHGIGKVSRKLDMLDTKQFMELRRDAIKNDGLTVSPVDYDINGTWDTTRNIDWQKELYGKAAQFSDVQASVSGGQGGTNFLLSSTYTRETLVFPGDFSDTKGSLHLNLHHASANQKLQLQLSTNYLAGKNRLPNGDITPLSMIAPDAPPQFNPDGSLNWAHVNGVATFFNAAQELAATYKNNTTNLISNLVISYELIRGLRIKSSFGYSSIISDEKRFIPIGYYDPLAFFKVRVGNYVSKSNKTALVEPQVEYKKTSVFGIFNFLVGASYQETRSNALGLMGQNYNTDLELENVRAAGNVTITHTIINKYRYNGLFGRIDYNLKNRYLLNLTARRDGSSRFGIENQFNNFYSVGGAWIFSNEKFISSFNKRLSFGKLKVSYGSVGNDQIPDYAFMPLFSSTTAASTINYQNAVGLIARGHSNPFLQWELTRKFNTGLELGLFSDRILIDINHYINSSSNQLLSTILPSQTGFTSVQTNLPAIVRNSGWEMLVDITPIKNKKLNWSSKLTLTIPKNQLVAFPNLEFMSGYSRSYAIGQPITATRVFEYAGVNPQTGLYEFFDFKGQKTSTPNSLTDKYLFVNTAPRFYGGFQNTIRYKGFELDFFLQFTKQLGANRFWRFGHNVAGYFNLNMPASAVHRWRSPGDIAYQQKANSTFTTYTTLSMAWDSNEAYDDISFISLKNASVSYQLPGKMTSAMKLTQLNIFVQGQNLMILTKFKGVNPEVGTSTGLPVLRMVSMGLRIML